MTEYLKDGTTDWSMGQDAWHHPDRIQPNQYASGVNVSSRGGVLGPRNGWFQVDLKFENRTLTTRFGYVRHIKDIWESGKFQALIPYFEASERYLITVISGLIFKTNTRTGSTVLLSEDIKLDQYRPRINWSYAGAAIVLFDYPDYPIIIQGTTISRSDPNHLVGGVLQPQVPIARMGAYNQNRLFIANAGTEFTAGDPIGSLATPEAPLTFTEIFAPSSPYVNQFFSLPTDETTYPITAIGFIQELDQNTGIGPMFVANEKNVFFFRTNQPRSDWGKGQFGGLLLANAGIAGPRACVNVNSDLVFLSADGNVHSFSTARNEMQHWGNVPISREVNNYLKYYDRSLMQFACLGYFNNRVFISANPYRVQAQDRAGQPVSDYANGGFVCLDIESVASLLVQGTPTWNGLWTGINPMDICNIGGRCFVMSKDGCGNVGCNALYELQKDSFYDTVKGNKRQVTSIVYTKLYNFNDEFGQKREQTVSLHWQDLEGKVYLKLERKPTHADEYSLWGEFNHEAPNSVVGMPADEFLNGFSWHELKQIIFGDAVVQDCSEINSDDYNTFRAVQLRITLRADNWVLENVKLEARLLPYLERTEADLCGALKNVPIPAQLEPDWLIPEMSLCN